MPFRKFISATSVSVLLLVIGLLFSGYIEPGQAKVFAEQDASQVAAENDQVTCAEKNGVLSWIFCPFFDGVSNDLAEGAEEIISGLLAVEPLKIEDPQDPIYQTWSSIKLLANVGFVIIFLVFIFAQTAGYNLNAYSVKRMIPRLVAASILVQFSFLITAVVVDIGNVLGAGIGQLIGAAMHGGDVSDFTAAGLVENILAAAALYGLASVAWPLAFPIALMVLLSVAAVIIVLGLRYFLIGVLIITGPLAFVAWVLPNTEQYFSRWLSTLIKLVLMYPIIIALLTVAGNVDALVPAASSGGDFFGAGVAVSIMKVLVFIACFIAITQTFKWAGGMMNQAYEGVGKIRKKGIGRVKDSENWSSKKDRMKTLQLAKADKYARQFQGMTHSNNKLARGTGKGLLEARSLLFASRGATSAARQRDSSSLVKGMDSDLKDLSEANPPNLKRALMAYYSSDPDERAEQLKALRRNGGEALVNYTKSFEGRRAMVRRLADINLVGGELTNAMAFSEKSSPKDFAMLMKENGKNLSKSPGLYARFEHLSDPEKETKNPFGDDAKLGDINADMAKGFIKGLNAYKLASDDFKLDNFKVMTDTDTPDAERIGKQWTQFFSEKIDSAELAKAYDFNNRSFMSGDKRAELLKAMVLHKDVFDPDVRTAVLDQIRSQRDKHESVINDLKPAERADLGL